MSYRSQRSSRHSNRRGQRKTHHQKTKRKKQKHRSTAKYLIKASEATTFKEVVEKTLSKLSNLGDQTFAFPPFSQYYNDWLLSLRSVLSEFESNPATNLDQVFIKYRSLVINDVELKLAQRRNEEATLEKSTRSLVLQNNLLRQTDIEHANVNQKLKSKRNRDIRRLTRIVHDFEKDLEEVSQMKASILSPFTRRAMSHKKAEVTQKLNTAKGELEVVMKAFKEEQEKIHDDYKKRKQTIIDQVRNLEKKVEGLETDGSVEDRQNACKALINAVKALLQRKMSHP